MRYVSRSAQFVQNDVLGHHLKPRCEANMSEAAELYRLYLADQACGDMSESEPARMGAEIAAADDMAADGMARAGTMSGSRHLRRSTDPWPMPLQIELVKHNADREKTPGRHATPEV